jgi:hypothetical protein
VTVPPLAEKLAVVDPAAMVTDAGTVSAGLLAETATIDPPEGANPESVTVQVDVAPEARVPGEHCNADTVTGAGIIVSAAVLETPFSEDVIVTL